MNIEAYKNIRALDSPSDIFDVENRVGVIVGGAGKMGQQFSKILNSAGAKVAIADIDEKKCEKLAKEISSRTNVPLIGCQCDVAEEKQVQKLFKTVYERYGQIDFLIYNVMTKPEGYYKPLNKYSIQAWKKVIDGNLTGAFLCCKESEKYLSSSEFPSIILTSSTYGIVGADQRVYRKCTPVENIYGTDDPLNLPISYSASKAGIIGLTRYLAALWGSAGIRVNALVPGGVYDGQEESFHDEYVNRTPLGRMAVWSDFNGIILFLASDASRYMTGSVLVVDGGWTAW